MLLLFKIDELFLDDFQSKALCSLLCLLLKVRKCIRHHAAIAFFGLRYNMVDFSEGPLPQDLNYLEVLDSHLPTCISWCTEATIVAYLITILTLTVGWN